MKICTTFHQKKKKCVRWMIEVELIFQSFSHNIAKILDNTSMDVFVLNSFSSSEKFQFVIWSSRQTRILTSFSIETYYPRNGHT